MKRWEENETDFLLNNYETMSYRKIGNNFNRSVIKLNN